jgi:hypothetical protein
MAEKGKTELSLEDLSGPFSCHICEHLRLADKQSTSSSSKFLEACRKFNQDEFNNDNLVGTTVRTGFNNVIDAFHVVSQGEVGVRFFTDERRNGGGIRLTDDIFRLNETLQASSLGQEVEARWRLVETSWSLNLSRKLVAVQTDGTGQTLFVAGPRRIAVTSSRDALNGYQKGRYFYCFDEISVSPSHPRLADVDHFFPWLLNSGSRFAGVDGVWNLVLACRSCNRGKGGKSDQVPSVRLLERLHRRNSYLIDSHHPLRETLMLQTGRTEGERRSFLQKCFNDAQALLGVHTWEPPPQGSALF